MALLKRTLAGLRGPVEALPRALKSNIDCMPDLPQTRPHPRQCPRFQGIKALLYPLQPAIQRVDLATQLTLDIRRISRFGRRQRTLDIIPQTPNGQPESADVHSTDNEMGRKLKMDIAKSRLYCASVVLKWISAL